MKKEVMDVFFSRIVGFLVFLLVLAVLNIINPVNLTLSQFINFFNDNLILFFLITFFFLISDIFWIQKMPFNLIAPILTAISSMFLITFLQKMISFGLDMAEVYMPTRLTLIILYPVVFLIVMVVGYVKIYNDNLRKTENKKKKIKRTKKQKDNAHSHKEPVTYIIDHIEILVKKLREWLKLD